jgi:hypothetical protein
VSDVTIMGVTSAGTNAIQDDETSTTVTDATVGMYVLGEQTTSVAAAYSRFTTSPNFPTWVVGTDEKPMGNCSKGSLYSDTAQSVAPYTLYGCVNGTWGQHIK